jgi:hypothetical protein
MTIAEILLVLQMSRSIMAFKVALLDHSACSSWLMTKSALIHVVVSIFQILICSSLAVSQSVLFWAYLTLTCKYSEPAFLQELGLHCLGCISWLWTLQTFHWRGVGRGGLWMPRVHYWVQRLPLDKPLLAQHFARDNFLFGSCSTICVNSRIIDRGTKDLVRNANCIYTRWRPTPFDISTIAGPVWSSFFTFSTYTLLC